MSSEFKQCYCHELCGGVCLKCDAENAARYKELETKNARLQATADTLGAQICEFHDTNPLNETVVELEKERDEALRRQANACSAAARAQEVALQIIDGAKGDPRVEALEAENRVVREIVEDALDRLWVRDKEYYQRIYARCTWLMEEEHQHPIDAEEVLRRLDIRIEAIQTLQHDWEVRMNGHVIGNYHFATDAQRGIAAVGNEITRIARQTTDPLLARIASLLREYQDYMTIADHCTEVYDHFSGGRISKPFTLPAEVIAQAEAIQQEDFETWHQERLEPIRETLQAFATAWHEALTEERCDIGRELMGWIEETFKETS